MGNKKFTGKCERPFPSLRGHIWIEGQEGTLLGYGRIALLERIREYGSITKAAKALEMSYRRAWLRYLELAPNGAYAAEVRRELDALPGASSQPTSPAPLSQ